jgi:lipoprotein-anchoring transpeptidase ErfK/SrfK
VDALLAEGRWREARAKLAPLFVAPCSDADRTSLSTKGLEISQQLLVLKPDEKDLELYEIQQGDTLEGIAKKFKTLNGVKGAVMLLNNYKENSVLRVGRKVKVPRGAWSIVVDKTLFKLWICYEGAPVKAYPVTIGAENKPTPAAKFVVGVRNPKPAWWPPAELNIKEAPIKYGDPRNPLGEWWVALDHDMHHGIGIHGTNEPQTIGTKASNGCVRMLNDDVCEVAAITYKGMVVTVVE